MTTPAPESGRNWAQALGALPRESVVSAVAKRLLEHLSSGEVAIGERLPPERDLAQILGVGRSATREALAVLDLLGIVTIRPGSGTFLRSMTSDLLPYTMNWGLMLGAPDVLDLVELRQHLEIVSATLAATRADDAARARLEQTIERMHAMQTDPKGFIDADVAFHLELAESTGNAALRDLLAGARSLLQEWVRRAIENDSEMGPTTAEHQAVLDAVLASDPRAAAAAMTAHMDSASARLRRSIES